MKKIAIGMVATAMVAGLIPFALVAKSRATPKDALPVHLVMDMDKQSKGKAQRETSMFADHRFMRPQVEGTLAQEDLWLTGQTLNFSGGTKPILLAGGQTQIQLNDPVMFTAVTQGRIWPVDAQGKPGSDEDFAAIKAPSNETEIASDTKFYVHRIPSVFDVSADMLHRGQERFVIYCAPCHGESGYGNGPVAQRASDLMKQGGDRVALWTDPQNLQEAKIIARPDGHIFNTITNGVRNMPAYDKQISIEDRWAIVAYVRALERSQNAHPDDPGVRNP